MLDYFRSILEAHPFAGYVSSASTTFVSLTGTLLTVSASAAHVATVLIGLAGMTLGALGGYYTFRIQRHKWLETKSKK